MNSIYLGFAIGILYLLFFTSFISFRPEVSLEGLSDIFVINLIGYGCLGYCYFHFINLGETARRIRILRELYEAGDGLKLGELLNRYSAKEIFQKRTNRLINSGQIIFKDGKYYIGKPTVLWISKIIIALKIIILGKRSEFD
ncbi:MAG: hypothetical protein ABIE81_03615 [Candidatus Omnitrophota bacterium]